MRVKIENSFKGAEYFISMFNRPTFSHEDLDLVLGVVRAFAAKADMKAGERMAGRGGHHVWLADEDGVRVMIITDQDPLPGSAPNLLDLQHKLDCANALIVSQKADMNAAIQLRNNAFNNLKTETDSLKTFYAEACADLDRQCDIIADLRWKVEVQAEVIEKMKNKIFAIEHPEYNTTTENDDNL